MKYSHRLFVIGLLLFAQLVCPLFAEDTSNPEELAKKLSNPVSNLISIPFQNDFESGLGAGQNGSRYTLKVQPIVPVSFNKDWDLIIRPIVPLINQSNVYGSSAQKGLSDSQLQLFFLPKASVRDDVIWGAGPVFLFPTATEALLGSEKWGIGPNACVVKQTGPWTIGLLANHLWSFAGNSNRSNISMSYLQPFASHSNKHGFTFSFASETSYDWLADRWTIPLVCGISQILPAGGHLISAGASVIYHLQSPSNTSKWSARVSITLLFPQ